MKEGKVNVVISMLHTFVLEEAKNKGIEIIAKAKYSTENKQSNIEEITNSVNEFLDRLEKISFDSQQTEIFYYRGFSPKRL